jgi:hypothetical protein
MQGATASNETLGGVGTDGRSQESARVGRRRLALIALVVIVAFGAAFAIGAATKKHDAQQAAPQLAPSTSVQGAHSVGVTAVSANAAIPDLKSPPPPKHKAPKQTTSTSNTSPVTPTAPVTPSNPRTTGSQIGGGTVGGGQTGGGGTVGGGGTTGGGGTVGGGGVSGGGGT